MKNTTEKCNVIFRNGDGREITVTCEHEGDNLTVNIDFGDEGSVSHEGLHVRLLNSFLGFIQSGGDV